MIPDLSTLDTVSKLLFSIELQPLQGARFQPTGFPSLGAATYQTNQGTSLLVESAQSMANRLEAVCWDEVANAPKAALAGISYVRVERQGKYLTSSVTEAHRLNSVYIEKANSGGFHEELKKAARYDDKKPIDRWAFVEALLKYDVGSLVHGVFLESIAGRLRIARALSAFIEAENVRQVVSGGVKTDHIQPGKEEEKSAKEGFGNVPFPREEYTAEKITLFVNLDLAQIRGYGLGADVERLLALLALFKLRTLLDGDLRLRTACNLEVKDTAITATKPAGYVLPSSAELVAGLKAAIAACKGKMVVTTVVFDDELKAKDPEKGEKDESSKDAGEEDDET
ncbi:MAG: type I-U CRISPR-associated RAMP protein Csb1/Cas7u [Opitutaceae bacterium]|jgi:CRISPR-associated protein Csb1